MNQHKSGFVSISKEHKSGFVSILGRPNAGKSTLLNTLVGQKVAIVADKPQTTRTAIQGVYTAPEAQIVFLDTPGIHKSDSPINKRMMAAVREALDERDAFLFLVDASEPFTEEDTHALSLLRVGGPPVVLAMNKIDLLPNREALLPLLTEYQKHYDFASYLPVSAAKGTGIALLMQELIGYMPEGPEYFPEDHVTDQPARFLAAELIREQVLRLTRQEVPHSTTVFIEKWEETPKLLRIYATVMVERDGQKAIVIGKQASVLKEIGTQSRLEMESLFGIKIFLDLHVKVEEGWREKPAYLNSIDWRTMSGRDES